MRNLHAVNAVNAIHAVDPAKKTVDPAKTAGTPAAAGTPGAVAEVPVGSLLCADSPRTVRVDESHAQALAQSGQALPPLLVHRATMRIIDGTHRLRAAVLRGQRTVGVTYFDGSAEDAFVLSVEANISHGLPLTHAERTAAALRILRSHPDWSDRGIARRTGLAPKTVAALRRREGPAAPVPKARVGQDGRLRPSDPARGREAAARLLAGRPTASLRQIAREAGIAPSTVRDVRRRIGEGADPVPATQRRSGNTPVPDAATAPARGRGQGGGRAQGQTLPSLVGSLCKDPLLRLSEAGRLLLRMLDLQVSGLRQRERLVAAVPPYRAETAAAAAAQVARDWQELSEELGRRASVETPA
ncbi:ParB N-terminal domain-containing protein [Streptomyces sp. ISL-94]|uniref:ParB/RepB/Spo0J family partition protein n=1 Tax=Streptomyces sp. ISL-94 TaxID=2819190 RepID=UPI001BEADA03|nr:ParB N-terminal domain-containing protein [Streptomyces sp. ISL-94]MBT2481164.1 ParB N-terminal domain-containing protein [Streptomyces sp. ISL-94]